MLQRWLFIAVAAFIFAACQTSMVREFDKVHNGMDKHQVLQLMGSPNTSARLHDRDRWIYRFYDNDVRYDKEIHFIDDQVVYVGGPWTPTDEKSAVVEDKKNAEDEAVHQADAAQREKDRLHNAELFREYEKHTHGNDKVEYLPDFKEVK